MAQIPPASADAFDTDSNAHDTPVEELFAEIGKGLLTLMCEAAVAGVFSAAGSYLCDRPWSAAAAYVTGRVGGVLWREASQEIARLEDAQSSGMIATDEAAARETKPYRLLRGAAAVLCSVSFAFGVSLAKDTTAKWGSPTPNKPAAVAPADRQPALG